MATNPSERKPINYLFYCNKISLDDNYVETIDYIHKNWFGNYSVLEARHDYIQWLFPMQEKSRYNSISSPLQMSEAQLMCKSEEILIKIITSYRLMLDFYGIQLVDYRTGDLVRAPNYVERYANIEANPHNCLRITRILTSLGQLGLGAYKQKLLQFLMNEILGIPSFQQMPSGEWKATFEGATPQAGSLLASCKDSLISFWIPACNPKSTHHKQLAGGTTSVASPKTSFITTPAS